MKIVNGNLITMVKRAELDVIVHGCNCFCTMGAGIAKQIKREFPEAYKADLRTQKGDRNKLGSITFASFIRPDNSAFWIVNAYTQFSYGRNGVYVDYEALRECFSTIKSVFRGKRIGYPLIGCSLAGGDWNIVSKIIDEELEGEDHTLVVIK